MKTRALLAIKAVVVLTINKSLANRGEDTYKVINLSDDLEHAQIRFQNGQTAVVMTEILLDQEEEQNDKQTKAIRQTTKDARSEIERVRRQRINYGR